MANTVTIHIDALRRQLAGRAGVRIEEAAGIVDSHPTTITRLVKVGELQQYHVGRHPRITTESLIAFLERGGRSGAVHPMEAQARASHPTARAKPKPKPNRKTKTTTEATAAPSTK